jgi:hypothetical protein
VEITRSRATRRAILKVPGRSPASTSWPATSASSATASACSAPSSASPPPRARPARVVDQPRYQRLLGVGVVPVAVGLARPVVVVGAKLDRTGCRISRRTRRIAATSWVTVSVGESPSGLRGGLEGDGVAEGLELLDEVGLVPVGVAVAGAPVAAEVVVVAVVGEQVPGDHQDRVANGAGGLLVADASGQPPELGGQVGVAAAGSGPGAPRSAPRPASGCLCGLARAALAAGEVVARAATRPRRQMAAVGNTPMSVPISAMIVSAARLPTPVMVAEPVTRRSERGDHLVHALVELADGAPGAPGAQATAPPATRDGR